MANAGDGYNVITTGLTHDEKGYPVITAEAQEKLVRRLVDKIRLNAKDIMIFEKRTQKMQKLWLLRMDALQEVHNLQLKWQEQKVRK
jgi:2-oxoglutarate ferredoxin oxidoreductase subunit alpha